MQQSFGKNEIAIGDTWNVSLQFVYLICFLLFVFPNEKANTHTHTRKRLCWNSLPKCSPFKHENRWWRWEAVHGSTASTEIFPPSFCSTSGLCMTQFHPSGLCPFTAGEAVEEFPSHLDLKVKYFKQMAFIWQLWWLGHHISQVLVGMQCVWQTGYEVGIIAHILCMTIFYLLFVLLWNLGPLVMPGPCWTRHCAERQQRKFLLTSFRVWRFLKFGLGEISSLFPSPTRFKVVTHWSCRKGDVHTQKPVVTPVKRSVSPAQQLLFLSKAAFVLFCKNACASLLLWNKHQMCFATVVDLILTS